LRYLNEISTSRDASDNAGLSCAKNHLATQLGVLRVRNRLELLFDKFRWAYFGRVVLNQMAEICCFFDFGADCGRAAGRSRCVSGDAGVDVMEAAEDGLADDFAVRLHRSWDWRVLVERHVGTSELYSCRCSRSAPCAGVSRSDDDMVQAFPTECADAQK